jgi:hypothetical protein
MAVLLLKVQGLRVYNFSIFAPRLFLYDDFIVFKRRKWILVREMTISYSQIAQVNLHRILYLSHLEIRSTGTDDIMIKFLFTPQAKKAKKIIDRKIHEAHRGHGMSASNAREDKHVVEFERSLNRLRELVHRGQISEREYKQKKKNLLKKLK